EKLFFLHVEWTGNLVLTGAGRAISADGPVGFRIHLDDNSQDSSIEETWKKSVLLYREDPTFDRPLLDIANTPYGPVEVTYAILSQGVECKVAVRLTHRDVKILSAFLEELLLAASCLILAACFSTTKM
uniref:DUF6598 domain-containing protein n=1 Tax=Aegilops tauschii subsp. strangulata TaxID=200361 RepID=A0A453SUE6_AEGTS